MKLIGKNSVSSYASFLFLSSSILCLILGIYYFVGYKICEYYATSGLQLKNSFYSISEFTYKNEKISTYQINIPFTKTKLINSTFNGIDVITITVGFIATSFYFWLIFKIFNNFSREKVFSRKVNYWLRFFTIYNIFFSIIYIIFWISLTKTFQLFSVIFALLPFLLIISVSVFVQAFFKKGRDLQSENDLTI